MKKLRSEEGRSEEGQRRRVIAIIANRISDTVWRQHSCGVGLTEMGSDLLIVLHLGAIRLAICLCQELVACAGFSLRTLPAQAAKTWHKHKALAHTKASLGSVTQLLGVV